MGPQTLLYTLLYALTFQASEKESEADYILMAL